MCRRAYNMHTLRIYKLCKTKSLFIKQIKEYKPTQTSNSPFLDFSASCGILSVVTTQ